MSKSEKVCQNCRWYKSDESYSDKTRCINLERDDSKDYGDCLWWRLPVEEPPYCGNPLDCNFPDDVTHFTRIIVLDEK